MRTVGFALALFSAAAPCTAQSATDDAAGLIPGEIESFALTGSPRVDGIFVAPDGRIFGAGTYAGSDVYLIHPDGSHEIIATGLDGPTDLGMDGAGNLYVTNFNGASVSRISPDGVVTTHASVPEGPSGIVVDPDGTVFVAHYGGGNGTGRSVSRIAPDRTVTEFARSDEMVAPTGLARGPGGDIYAANFYDGKIFRIGAGGSLRLFAQVTLPDGTPSGIGHISSGNGGLIATTGRRNRIYQVDAGGTVALLTGNGSMGTKDGLFEEATVGHPNGVAETPDGRVLVATAGNGLGDRSTLRVLVFGGEDNPGYPGG